MRVNEKPAWTKEFPYDRFLDFLSPNADRYKMLLELAEKLRLSSSVISIEGGRHIFIFPPGQKLVRAFSGKSPVILTAHYDRVDGSPGANDNSAAVFQLLKTAAILADSGDDNWIIIFTDKEELKAGDKIEAQGSFSLAKKLKSYSLENAKIYNFDACGTGDTLIISSTTDHILKNGERPGLIEARKLIIQLRDHALAAAHSLRLDKVLLAPTPFSDDAGFLRAGLPSQTITMLPAREANTYVSLLRKNPDFADILIAGKFNSLNERRQIPETWRVINSAADIHLRLTPQYFAQVINLAAGLCRQPGKFAASHALHRG